MEELSQIWTDEPGTFIRVCADSKTGKVLLEIRCGPQGSVAASHVRDKFILTGYRVQRLSDILSKK